MVRVTLVLLAISLGGCLSTSVSIGPSIVVDQRGRVAVQLAGGGALGIVPADVSSPFALVTGGVEGSIGLDLASRTIVVGGRILLLGVGFQSFDERWGHRASLLVQFRRWRGQTRGGLGIAYWSERVLDASAAPPEGGCSGVIHRFRSFAPGIALDWTHDLDKQTPSSIAVTLDAPMRWSSAHHLSCADG